MPSMKQRFRQLATDWFSLPPDTLQDVSRVTCLNGEQVIVENIAGLLKVTKTLVDIDLGHAILRVEGDNFVVTLASADEVQLEGQVAHLTYLAKQGGRR